MKSKQAWIILLLLVLTFSLPVSGARVPPDWKQWNAFPKGTDAPRYTADRIQELLLAGEKMVFIYAGYEVDEIVCGSLYLPYTLVPPFGDGARVNLSVPKDTWMVAYCP